MKLRSFLFGLFQLLACTLYAQNAVRPSAMSLELNKFSEYPVSINTGVPEISIPLYSIEFGGQQIPIMLRYHASGIKLGQTSGNVGVGWSFSPVFQISRTIRGREDDLYPMPNLDSLNWEYISSGSSNFSTKLLRDRYLARFARSATGSNSNYPPIFGTGTLIDSEMDIYRYTLADRSGRFVFASRNPFLAALIDNDGRELDIDFHKRTPSEYAYFNVKDDRGWAYTFGKDDCYQMSISNGIGYESAYYINHIRALNGDSLRFNYYNPTYSSGFSNSRSIYVKEGCKDCLPLNVPVNTIVKIDSTKSFDSREWFPESIQSPLNNISFSYFYSSTNNRSEYLISEIMIKDRNDVLLRTVNFYYTAGMRHTFLDSVKISGVDAKPSIYRIDYNMKDIDGTDYDNVALDADHWGYYVKSRYTSPKTQINFPEGYPSFNVIVAPNMTSPEPLSSLYPGIKAGIKNPDYGTTEPIYLINKITYPTGGYTEYKFDRNYVRPNPDISDFYEGTGPGFKVKEIISNDLVLGNTLKKTYQYQDEGETTDPPTQYVGYGRMLDGATTYGDTYIRQGAEIGVTPNSAGVPQKWILFNTYTFNNTYVGRSDFAALEENPVYYTKVTELSYANNGPINKTEYFFDLGDTAIHRTAVTWSDRNRFPNISSRGITTRDNTPGNYSSVILGNKPQLTSKLSYKNIQGTWRKYQKEELSYILSYSNGSSGITNISVMPYAYKNSDLSTGLSVGNIYTDTNIDSFFDFAVYKMNFYRRLLSEKIVTTYDE